MSHMQWFLTMSNHPINWCFLTKNDQRNKRVAKYNLLGCNAT
jgi:hypothetical protein